MVCFLWVFNILIVISFRFIKFYIYLKWSIWIIFFDVLVIYLFLVVKILFEFVEIDIKIRVCGFFKR